MVTLQALDPLYLDFFLPQQALAQIKVGQDVWCQCRHLAGRQNFAGQITAINPRSTPHPQPPVRATLPNPDHRLLPGMFATRGYRAPAHRSTRSRCRRPPSPTIPMATPSSRHRQGQGRAGQAATDRPADLRDHRRHARRPGRGLDGIKAGDVIVTAGQIKLRNGSPVVINNTVQPSDRPNPAPPTNDDSAMKFTDIFIRRPVLAIVVSLMILVLGCAPSARCRCCNIRGRKTPSSPSPRPIYGAAPDVVAGFITTPLENAIAQANGIDYMTSTSQSSSARSPSTCGSTTIRTRR